MRERRVSVRLSVRVNVSGVGESERLACGGCCCVKEVAGGINNRQRKKKGSLIDKARSNHVIYCTAVLVQLPLKVCEGGRAGCAG